MRTAIISGDGQLFMVKEGEKVTPRYRVAKISADVVELLDLDDSRATARAAMSRSQLKSKRSELQTSTSDF